MDPGSWHLNLLWRIPRLPKKKIKQFINLGDEYLKIGKINQAKFCYEKSLTLATDTNSVYYMKKIDRKIDLLSLEYSSGA